MKRILLSVFGLAVMTAAPMAKAVDLSVNLGDGRFHRGDGVRIERGDRWHEGERWREGRGIREHDRARLVRESERVIREPDGDRVVITRRVYEEPDGDRFVRESRRVIER